MAFKIESMMGDGSSPPSFSYSSGVGMTEHCEKSEKLNFVEINYQHRNSYLVTSIYIHYHSEKSICHQMNKCPTIPTYPKIIKYVLLSEETSMFKIKYIWLFNVHYVAIYYLQVLSQHILNYSDVAKNKLDNVLYSASAAYWETKKIDNKIFVELKRAVMVSGCGYEEEEARR